MGFNSVFKGLINGLFRRLREGTDDDKPQFGRLACWEYKQVFPACKPEELLRWSKGSALAFGTQVRGFTPGRSRRIFRTKKSSVRLSSEGT